MSSIFADGIIVGLITYGINEILIYYSNIYGELGNQRTKEEKECLNCEKEFIPTRYTTRQNFCSAQEPKCQERVNVVVEIKVSRQTPLLACGVCCALYVQQQLKVTREKALRSVGQCGDVARACDGLARFQGKVLRWCGEIRNLRF